MQIRTCWILGSVHELTLPVAQNEIIVLVLYSHTIYKALGVFKVPVSHTLLSNSLLLSGEIYFRMSFAKALQFSIPCIVVKKVTKENYQQEQ